MRLLAMLESNSPKKVYRPQSASRFRERNHESAHAEAEHSENPSSSLQHALVTHAAPELINTQAQLIELLAHLRAAGVFAYDSEFIGELTYIPKLCLIQVASSKRVA